MFNTRKQIADFILEKTAEAGTRFSEYGDEGVSAVQFSHLAVVAKVELDVLLDIRDLLESIEKRMAANSITKTSKKKKHD